MSHFCFPEPHLIAKAGRRRRTVSKAYEKLDSLSRRMKSAVKIELYKGIETFKKRVKPSALEDAWHSGDYGGVMRAIPLQEMPGHLGGMRTSLMKSMAAAGSISIEALPAPKRGELRWDVKNPTLQNWLREGTGRLIQNITDDTRQNVSRSVRESFTQAMTPRRVSDQIKDSIRTIGLDERRANALSNYRSGLEQKGDLAPNRVDELVHKYADRLLDQRCMTIARTEVRQANNYTQLSVWKEAADQGLIERETTRKVWIVDGNPCDICEPMDGVSVLLDEQWVLNDGDTVDMPNESHPNCMCGMELEVGESEES